MPLGHAGTLGEARRPRPPARDILRHLRRGKAIAIWLVAATVCVGLGLSLVPSARSHGAQPVFVGAYTSFPDYMDPQLSYTSEGWTAMYDVYVPLLTYRHADGKAGSEVIPGLARAMPKVTDGGRTYTLFLRHGLRYSSGRPVRASDFRFTVERLYRLHSSGAFFYDDIAGARDFAKGRARHIAGIATDDRNGKIVVHLLHPSATFTDELALLFVAPVPPSTPLRDQSSDPPPATGPYVITGSRPGLDWSYARNPAWRRNGKLMRSIPGGHVGRIDIDVIPNQKEQVEGLKDGQLDWLFDPPPADRMGELEKGAGGVQLRVRPSVSTYYFWMNTQKAPFDDLRVRQAVNYAVNPAALRRIYEGQMSPTDQILPPQMPGYRRFDLYPHDLATARRLIREADPKDRRITVWTDGESTERLAGEYYVDVLRKIGFKPLLKIAGSDDYFSAIGNPRTPNLDTGISNWFEDFPHPLDFFQPLLVARPGSGARSNFSQLVAPGLNRKVDALARRSGPIDGAAYARLDRGFMKLAPIVPFGNRSLVASFSRVVDLKGFVWNPTFESDFTSFRFKPPAPAPRHP
jgi:peptide/nickel transport system substrate-binding protein